MGGMIGFSLMQGSTRDARIKAIVIRAAHGVREWIARVRNRVAPDARHR